MSEKKVVTEVDKIARARRKEIAENGRIFTTADLFEADPNCKHRIINSCGGGIRCLDCKGWACF